jgi:hypothetical protein
VTTGVNSTAPSALVLPAVNAFVKFPGSDGCAGEPAEKDWHCSAPPYFVERQGLFEQKGGDNAKKK